MATTNIATNIPLRVAKSRTLRNAECRGQLLARGDVELLVGVMEVGLDRPHGHEQRLRDLLVRHSVRRHARHPALARGERLDSGPDDLARTSAGGGELVVGS